MICFSFLKIVFSDIQVTLILHGFYTLCNFRNQNLIYLFDPIHNAVSPLRMLHPLKSHHEPEFRKQWEFKDTSNFMMSIGCVIKSHLKKALQISLCKLSKKILALKSAPFWQNICLWRLGYKPLCDYNLTAFTVDSMNWFFVCIF